MDWDVDIERSTTVTMQQVAHWPDVVFIVVCVAIVFTALVMRSINR